MHSVVINNRMQAGSDAILKKMAAHPDWPVYSEVFNQAPSQLQTREPVWSDMIPINV